MIQQYVKHILWLINTELTKKRKCELNIRWHLYPQTTSVARFLPFQFLTTLSSLKSLLSQNCTQHTESPIMQFNARDLHCETQHRDMNSQNMLSKLWTTKKSARAPERVAFRPIFLLPLLFSSLLMCLGFFFFFFLSVLLYLSSLVSYLLHDCCRLTSVVLSRLMSGSTCLHFNLLFMHSPAYCPPAPVFIFILSAFLFCPLLSTLLAFRFFVFLSFISPSLPLSLLLLPSSLSLASCYVFVPKSSAGSS